MKKATIISSLISIIILFSCGQTSQENSLIGVWELDKQDNGIKSDLMIKPIEKSVDSKTQKEPEIILKFNDNSILDFKQGLQSFRANYSLKEEQLILGTTEYIILRLDADSLIIKEVSQFMPTTYYYIKSDRDIKTIKEYEEVEEKYSDGRLKIKGMYHNGLEDGQWEEWFENGQKKSKREFKDGIPTGTWKEWNESGELINERKIN